MQETVSTAGPSVNPPMGGSWSKWFLMVGAADAEQWAMMAVLMASSLLSIAYLTILGFWIAPGSHCDAMFMADAVLLDVGNEYLYLTAQSEATAGVVQPMALLKENVPVQRAKTEALNQLVQELEKRFQNLKGGHEE